MRLRPTAAVVLRYFYLLRGSFSRVLPLFAWVAVDIVLWGFLTRYLDQVASGGRAFVPTLLGAVLMWDFFTRVMQGVTMTFFEDVWSRNFLNFFATPLRVSEYLGGLVLTSVATSLVGLVVMIVLASGIFGLSLLSFGLLLIPFLLNLFLFGIALGIVASAIVLRLGPAAEWFVWPIPALLSPFVAVLYPLETLPVWMQLVGRALAPTYVFEGLRSLTRGEPVPAMALVVSFALNGLYLVLAAWAFRRTFRYAVRVGLIARYSAETVS